MWGLVVFSSRVIFESWLLWIWMCICLHFAVMLVQYKSISCDDIAPSLTWILGFPSSWYLYLPPEQVCLNILQLCQKCWLLLSPKDGRTGPSLRSSRRWEMRVYTLGVPVSLGPPSALSLLIFPSAWGEGTIWAPCIFQGGPFSFPHGCYPSGGEALLSP